MIPTLRGSCLCGNVEFRISGEIPKIYQCHCSLCRKVSGSASNAALLIEAKGFEWATGENEISSYSTRSGFKSDFCGTCGSPVPNLTRDGSKYWIPAGLLEESALLEVSVHVYVGSKAGWDVISGDYPHFQKMPDEETLKQLIGQKPKNPDE